MRSGTMLLAEVMCQRANVCASSALNHEVRYRSFHFREPKLENFHFDRLETHRLVFACQLVSRSSVNFLGGKRWRNLLYVADKLRCQSLDLICIEDRVWVRTQWLAIGVVSISGKTKPYRATVSFAPTRVETR